MKLIRATRFLRTATAFRTAAIFLSIVFCYLSCTKLDTGQDGIEHADALLTQRFLTITATAPALLKRVSEVLKTRNDQQEFIRAFARQNGFPVWEKVKLQLPEPMAARGDSIVHTLSGDTVVIIPIVLPDSNFVNGFITARLHGTVTLNWYRASDYDIYSFDEVQPDSISADKATLQLMVLNNYVFGYTRFLVKDSRLFSNRTVPAPAGHTDRIFTLTDSAGLAGKSTLLLCTTCIYWVCAVCHGQDPNCPLGGTGFDCMDHFCVGGFPSDPEGTGGGSSPTGGGGDETPSPSDFPCASRQQPGAPLPAGCSPNPAPGPVIPLPFQENDPCTTAQAAAKKMDTIFTKSRADSLLATIPDVATGTNEKGFNMYKKFIVNPQNVTDTSFPGTYRLGAVFTGTDSSVSINENIPHFTLATAWLHIHPPGGYAAQSAKDIYQLIEDRLEEPHYEGSFVAAYDGSQYAVTVTDVAAAAAFAATKDQNLEGTTWKDDSEIWKAFLKAQKFFENEFKGNSNKKNLAYEMAMAAVLNQYNTGVTLNKKDASGNFKPIVVKTSKDPRKSKKTIYTQDCL